MPITRRGLLASLVAFAGSAALPAFSAPRKVVCVSGPVFTAEMAADADAEWLEACVFSSWQIDHGDPDEHALIRHPMTGLTYAVFPDEEDSIVVQQIDAACCNCYEELDPDGIVGHAARFVAEAAYELFTDWQLAHDGPVYLRFPRPGEDDPPWPSVLEPESTGAPRIRVRPAVDLSDGSDA